MKAYSYIRFSTPDQIKGDSLRRQTEKAEKFCKEKDLILDTELNLRDLGLSAFKGKHRTQGGLSIFLKAIETGKVKPGSFLIVEDIDRLSREAPSYATQTLLTIIHSDISIVFMGANNLIVSKDTYNRDPSVFYQVSGSMMRAHEESRRKSELLQAAYANKRRMAKEHKTFYSRHMPAWLKYNEDTQKIETIPEAVEAVRLIFEMRLDGIGADRICQILNNRPDVWQPTKKPKKKKNHTGWHKYYVRKILGNPATLGILEFNQQRPDRQKRESEIINDYYPQIIEQDLFDKVQRAIQSDFHNKTGGGAGGKFSNIFRYILRCGHCGSPIHFISKGMTDGQNYAYLHCDASRRNQTDNGKRKCYANPANYRNFVRHFFADFEELDLPSLLQPEKDQEKRLKSLRRKASDTRNHIADNERQKANLIDDLSREDNSELRKAIRVKHIDLQESSKDLKNGLHEMEQEISRLEGNGKEMQKTIQEIRTFFKDIDLFCGSDKSIALRISLNNQLKSILNHIKLYTTPQDITPPERGLERWTNDKHIDRIVMNFKGSKKLRILQLQGWREV